MGEKHSVVLPVTVFTLTGLKLFAKTTKRREAVESAGGLDQLTKETMATVRSMCAEMKTGLESSGVPRRPTHVDARRQTWGQTEADVGKHGGRRGDTVVSVMLFKMVNLSPGIESR